MTDIVAGALYPAYLLVLLMVPLLVKWRWGLAASLVVTVAEVGLVALLYLFVFPADPYPVEPIEPGESPLGRIRRSQAHGYATLIVLALLPAMAALIGGTFSAAWWVIAQVWRRIAVVRPEGP